MPEPGPRVPQPGVQRQEELAALKRRREEQGAAATEDGEQEGAVQTEVNDAEALQQELALLQRERMLERVLDLPTSTEQKLEGIQNIVLEIVQLASQVSVEQYHQNPEQYQAAVVAVEQKMQELKAYLITFSASVDVHHPKVTFLQKFAVFLVAVLRGNIQESTLMRTLTSSNKNRNALLDSRNQFVALAGEQQQRVEKVRQLIQEEKEKPLRDRQEAILLENELYQKLLEEYREMKADYNIVTQQTTEDDENSLLKHYYTKYVGTPKSDKMTMWLYINIDRKNKIRSVLEAGLQKLEAQMSDIAADARRKAERELADEGSEKSKV